MDCSPPGSSIHGIFQARVLEWGAIAFSSKMFERGGVGEITAPADYPLRLRNPETANISFALGMGSMVVLYVGGSYTLFFWNNFKVIHKDKMEGNCFLRGD